ncbi:Glutathione peroxidase 7, partial [Lamprotornis superbus]
VCILRGAVPARAELRVPQKARLQQRGVCGSAAGPGPGRARRPCSMLDPEGSVEHQPASSFPKVLLIPLAMLLAIAALLLLAFSATRQKEPDFYTFKVVNIRGKLVSLEKYRGSVSAAGRGGSRPGSLTGSPCMSAGRARGRELGTPVHTRVSLVVNVANSTGEEPTWNFWKYLVDPNGKVVKAWDSTVSVDEIRPHVTELNN